MTHPSKCCCTHDGNSVQSACGMHVQYARDYAAKDQEAANPDKCRNCGEGPHDDQPDTQSKGPPDAWIPRR